MERIQREMPEIESGMVLELQPRELKEYESTFMLVTYVNGKEIVGYKVERDPYTVKDQVLLTTRVAVTPNLEIVNIYDTGDGTFPVERLLEILDGDIDLEYLVWEGRPVREMTVDEISKELGYKVKVIGNDC